MRIISGACFLATLGLLPLPSAAAVGAGSTIVGVLPCVWTRISSRRLPVGSAQYESGSLVLANGTTMRLQGTRAEVERVRDMAVGDPVAACRGPLKRYADAGPSRTITVLDLANGSYYGTLIGNWKIR